MHLQTGQLSGGMRADVGNRDAPGSQIKMENAIKERARDFQISDLKYDNNLKRRLIGRSACAYCQKRRDFELRTFQALRQIRGRHIIHTHIRFEKNF